MKTKTLALVDGIGGLIAGIILLFGPILVAGAVAGAVADAFSSGSTSSATGMGTAMTIVKILVLAAGIATLVYYKGSTQVKPAVGVLLTVGGAVSLIPFLGWAGGIVTIVGGAMALASLKHFDTPNTPDTPAPTQPTQQQ